MAKFSKRGCAPHPAGLSPDPSQVAHPRRRLHPVPTQRPQGGGLGAGAHALPLPYGAYPRPQATATPDATHSAQSPDAHKYTRKPWDGSKRMTRGQNTQIRGLEERHRQV